jgi:hypothetical protein
MEMGFRAEEMKGEDEQDPQTGKKDRTTGQLRQRKMSSGMQIRT